MGYKIHIVPRVCLIVRDGKYGVTHLSTRDDRYSVSTNSTVRRLIPNGGWGTRVDDPSLGTTGGKVPGRVRHGEVDVGTTVPPKKTPPEKAPPRPSDVSTPEFYLSRHPVSGPLLRSNVWGQSRPTRSPAVSDSLVPGPITNPLPPRDRSPSPPPPTPPPLVHLPTREWGTVRVGPRTTVEMVFPKEVRV